MKKNLIVIALSAMVLFSAMSDRPVAYEEAMNGISAGVIKDHIRFLAHDSLKGRWPGTPGYDMAARYMAQQFEKSGIQPGVGDSSYFQEVHLARFDLDYSNSALAVVKDKSSKLLKTGSDFVVYAKNDIEDISGEAELVFAGYGENYEEHNYAPYGESKLEGKIAFTLAGNPKFTSDENLLGISEKIIRARDAGASGLVIALTSRALNRYSWDRIRRVFTGGREFKTPESYGDFFVILANYTAVQEFAPRSPDSLIRLAEAKDFKAFDMGVRLKYRVHVNRNEELTVSDNVVGLLPGSDPELKNEYIVYTAHLDHVGVGVPVDGDSIYNGAYDNASGCAIMLEIARAFSKMDPAPKRSLLFIALTVEEIGLYGSRYFVRYPTIPIEQIAANINTDMILLEKPLESVVALGKEYADFEPVVDQSAQELNIELAPDPMPQERLFMRSDHYSFVQAGVPALFIINNFADSLNHAWFKTYYHRPQDEFSEDMHFEAGARYAQLNFLIGYRLAQLPERPRWRQDNMYGQRFGKNTGK